MGSDSMTEVLIISLIAIEVNKKLDNLRQCGMTSVIPGDVAPKMSAHVRCTKLAGHVGWHSDGFSLWNDRVPAPPKDVY